MIIYNTKRQTFACGEKPNLLIATINLDSSFAFINMKY